MKKLHLAVGFGVMALVLAIAPLTHAAEFVTPSDESNGNVIVTSSQTHRNLYIAGGTVTVDGATTGDLYAAGGTVIVSGPVEQDVVAAGGTLVLNGKVGGDVRAAGGNITINESIGGDLLIGGGDITLGEKAAITGDVIIGGGSATINGPVGGSVRISSDSTTINSAVAGKVMVQTGKSLVFGPNARVAGTVDHKGLKEAVVQDGAQVGPINFQIIERHKGAGRAFAGLITLAFVIKVVAGFLAAFALVYFMRRRMGTVIETMRSSPWSSLGIGSVAAIVVPIIALLLLVTFVGYYLAFLLFVGYVFLMAISCLIGAIFVGALVVKWLTKKDHLQLDWQAALIGTVLFYIVALIPVVGWIITAVVSLMAFGAYIKWCRTMVASERIN